MNLDEDQGVVDAPVLDDAAVTPPTDMPANPLTENTENEAQEGEKLDLENIEVEPDPEPVIEPPKFWSEKAKDVWDKLPPEAAAEIAKRETEQAGYIARKEAEAQQAKQSALIEAREALANTLYENAWTLEQLAPPPRLNNPDRSWLFSNDPGLIAQYQQLKAIDDDLIAEHQTVMQQVQQMRHQAKVMEEAETAQTAQAETEAILEAFPVLANPQSEEATSLLNGLTKVALELGYERGALVDANANDLKAISTAKTWKEKADKWDKAQANAKMAWARKHKTPASVSPNGQQQGPATSVADAEMSRLKAAYPTTFQR